MNSTYATDTDTYEATVQRAISKVVAHGIYPTQLAAAIALDRNFNLLSVWLALPSISSRI